MKVLKFGGTSVGSARGLNNLKKIVLSGKTPDEGMAVVVSALSGVTDNLLLLCDMAARSDSGFRDVFEALRQRHYGLCDELFPSCSPEVKEKMEPLLNDLKIKLKSVSTLGVLPGKTQMEIVSYGERLSSIIVSALLEGSVLMDSLSMIKTRWMQGKNVPDMEITGSLVKKAFSGMDSRGEIAVVQGFISSDSESGNITNLGRGGSDYTASILAAVLDTDELEIWTDVDGFMTADPRMIQTSYVIDTISFTDAMELCNFGAKVICPTALYPVRSKKIPILIKNTFNPSAKGTVIRCESGGDELSIVTGISSIADSCLLTVSGPSMAGIVGVDSRIFSALAKENISVFLVSQSSSETSISIGLCADVALRARELLQSEFAHEISAGSMNDIEFLDGVSTVALVGEQIKDNPGVAGKLFSVLGSNGIKVIASTQGAGCHNISIVVEKKFLKKSLNVLHDSFFLSEYKELNLFICGIGTVGGNLLEQIASQRETLMKENHLKLNVVGISKSDRAVFSRDGIDLCGWRERLMDGEPSDIKKLRSKIIGMNIFNAVFVDCTASAEIADLYKDFFNHGISVVAANKVAASSDYANYLSLKELALHRNVKFLFETNVGAGLPVINTINALKNSGDRILKLEAVLSGTLNFIFNMVSSDVPFSRAVMMAKEQGYSEPDPRVDLSGTDVIRKLVILSREAGYAVNKEDVQANLFIPEDFFNCSMEEFWRKLPELDGDFENRRKALEASGKRWRFVAVMDEGKLSVSLREFSEGHSFYGLEGSNNVIMITTQRYNRHPMVIQGYGAGAQVTAAGVFADIMSIANV